MAPVPVNRALKWAPTGHLPLSRSNVILDTPYFDFQICHSFGHFLIPRTHMRRVLFVCSFVFKEEQRAQALEPAGLSL